MKMYNPLIKVLVVVVLVLSIVNQSPEVSAVASKVQLTTNVDVYLNNKQMMPTDNGQMVLVTLKIINNSSKEINLIDYWARIKGSSNSYVTKLSSHDQVKDTILPGNAEYLTYYAYVSDAEELLNISVDVIQWDFSFENYERVVGNLKISEINQPKIQEEVVLNYGNLQLNTVLEDQFVLDDANNKIVSYRIKVKNGLNREADIANLKTYAIVNNVEAFEAKTVVSNSKINGRSEVYIYGQVNIPNEINIDSMSLALVYKEETNIFPLLVFPLEKLSERNAPALNSIVNINMNGLVYNLEGNEVDVSSETNRTNVSVSFNIKNVSDKNGKLSDMVFFIKTKKGLMYSLLPSENSVVDLLPEIEEVFSISGYVPNEQALIDAQLIVGVKVNEEQVIVKAISLGKLNITSPNDQALVAVNGQEINFERLTRIPNADKDLLVAEFILKNVSKDNKKPLVLSGQFILDGVKIEEKEINIVRMNTNLTLQAGESERIVAYMNVPFTQEIFDYKFELKVDGKSTKTLEMIERQSSRLLANNEKYTLKTVGKRGEVTYVNSQIFEGTKDNLFVVNINLKNIEKRNVTPSNLNGYIQTRTGEIYQLTFEKIDKTIMPNGIVTLTGSTTIPKVFGTTDLTIHFGEQLQQENTIYIDPVYIMYKPFIYQGDNISQMVYTADKKFWIWNAQHTWLPDATNKEGFKVAFDYQIEEVTNSYETLGDRSILIEYIDMTMPTIRMTKEIAMTGEGVAVGRGVIDMSFGNATISYDTLTTFNVNVYEVYKGYKRIASTQQFSY